MFLCNDHFSPTGVFNGLILLLCILFYLFILHPQLFFSSAWFLKHSKHLWLNKTCIVRVTPWKCLIFFFLNKSSFWKMVIRLGKNNYLDPNCNNYNFISNLWWKLYYIFIVFKISWLGSSCGWVLPLMQELVVRFHCYSVTASDVCLFSMWVWFKALMSLHSLIYLY